MATLSTSLFTNFDNENMQHNLLSLTPCTITSNMKPTHRLKVLDKSHGSRTTIGAGWENYDGSITIQLTPAVVLDYESCKDKVITLFPEREQ